MAWLDTDGLSHLWTLIKTTFAAKGDVPAASSTTPSMDGTGTTGTGTTFARADHVHPTDTSRAAASDLTSHTGDTTAHITAAERTLWNSKTDNTGTVTQVTGGVGLSGTVTNSGTIKANLKDETAHTADSAALTNVANRQYAVGVDRSGYLSVNVPWTDTADISQITGTLGVDHGGTGATTLTGIVKGNGTSAMTAAEANDVVTLLGTTAVNRAAADGNGANIADTYAKKTDIASMYKFKGSVASAAQLPSSGQTVGDVYNIEAASIYGGAGANVAWDGTAWDSLGEIFAITAITNAEIDAICV